MKLWDALYVLLYSFKLEIGHQDCSSSNGHQGDILHISLTIVICYYKRINHSHFFVCIT